MTVLYDLAAERFGHDLASIGLHEPTILTADFAIFEGLPDGEICLVGDESTSLRLCAVATLLVDQLVVHVLETADHETVIVALRLYPKGPVAFALKPGDVQWQQFLEHRMSAAAA
jgi:hypothetical protein